MIMKRFILTAVVVLSAQLALASDRYIVQGQVYGPMVSASDRLTWFSDAVLLNRGSTDAVVTVRKISNGGTTDGLRTTVVIPSGRSATLQGLRAWGTAPNAPLWVVQVDAPDTVDIEGLLRIGTIDTVTLASPTGRPDRFGRAQLPVFRSFVPAGERQSHLSTDLGNDLGNEVASRVNVGIYNPTAVTANATIEFRQHCDDTLLASTNLIVPPDTVIQVPGLGGTSHNCPSNDPSFLGGGGIYAVVTVDQPSASFVSVLSNALTPSNSISVRQ